MVCLQSPVEDGSMHHVSEVLRRRSPHASPEKATRERPKSEVLMVRWAENVFDLTSPQRRNKKGYTGKERPKSDIGKLMYGTEMTHKVYFY